MIEIKAISPNDKQQMNDFIKLPAKLYKGVEQYVPDLEMEIHDFFNPKKNPALAFTNIQAFLAYNDDGEAVGRIVGIVNQHANQQWNTQNVRFSMIEFVDDMAVSRALINAVAAWGKQQGMNALQGPMGITDFDKEGMLVEDFHLRGTMNTIYNPPYYPQHMEALGLKKEADWVQIRVDIPQEVPARYARVAQYAREEMGLRVIKLTNHMATHDGYGKRVFQLLNNAFKPIFGFSELTEEQIDMMVDQYLYLTDKKLIPLILNKEGELVGVAVTIPTLSTALQRANGKLLPFGWWHLLKALRLHSEGGAEMLVVGVRPDYQGYGANALFFEDLIPIYNKMGIKWAETGPQLEDNVKELSQWKPLNPTFVKRRRCYKKEI